jgi:hypothetical protein
VRTPVRSMPVSLGKSPAQGTGEPILQGWRDPKRDMQERPDIPSGEGVSYGAF